MSTKHQIFWIRVKQHARHNFHKAIQMLLEVGVSFEQAARFVAMARSV